MTLTQPQPVGSSAGALAVRRDPRAAVAALARDLRLPVIASSVHLALVLAFTGIASRYAFKLAPVPAVGYYLRPMTGWAHIFLEPLRNWDGFWYTLIAERGYQVHPATAAFWPLYPKLLAVLHNLTQWTVPTLGIIVSNLALVGALLLLYRLVMLDYGDSVARRTIWLLVLFPTAFYFSAVYTESLFLLLTVGAIYFARTEHWGWAALFGALAALTRNTGVLVLLPMGILLVRSHGWDPRRWWRIGAQLAVVALSPLIFLWHLDQVWGDPLLTIHVQDQWARYRAMPWSTLAAAFHQWDLSWFHQLMANPSWNMLTSAYVRWRFAESQTYDIFITLVFIPIVIYTLIKVRPAYSLYAALVFVVPMFSPSHVHPLMSMPRFVIVLFPLFIALAILLRKHRVLYGVVLALFVIQFAALLIQFSTWFWVA